MPAPWHSQALERLVESRNADGGWGYRPKSAGAAEPTALACAAVQSLAAGHTADPAAGNPGLAWLAARQQSDGRVPATAQATSPCWPTGLAMVAWALAPGSVGTRYRRAIDRAAEWLLEFRGTPVAANEYVFGHNPELRGWPWVANTHSWVEPTAQALLGLRAAERHDHPHYREGVAVLLDRALPDGGWNYGNTRVFGNLLRPFPATTGLVLTALAGEPVDPRIAASINYLTETLSHVRAPMSLGWGLIGLGAWGIRPRGADDWLAESATGRAFREPNCLETALLIIAATNPCPMLAGTVHLGHE